MSKRKSIYLGPAIERLLAERVNDDSGFRSTSGVLNAVADRYQEVVRQSTPRLSIGEWCLVLDSLNGVWMQEPASMVIGSLANGVGDSIRLDAADTKWEINGDALLAKLEALGFCARLALVDAAERFWAVDQPADTELRAFVAGIVGPGAIDGNST